MPSLLVSCTRAIILANWLCKERAARRGAPAGCFRALLIALLIGVPEFDFLEVLLCVL